MWYKYQYGNDTFRLTNLDRANNIHVWMIEIECLD
jgi:hypothetical protein